MSFPGNINFNAQHSPMGAFMSFTCGHFGTRGGIGVQIGKPANQDLFIGVKDGGRHEPGTLRCLPFFKAASGNAGAADYQVEQAGPAEQNVAPKVVAYGREQIERRYGWATDEWETPDFKFAIHSPFGPIPDPSVANSAEMRMALVPAVTAYLTIDNRAGTTTQTAFVAINFNEPGWRPLFEGRSGSTGFGLRRELGVVGWSERPIGDDKDPAGDPHLFCRWTPEAGLAESVPHRLGSCPGLLIEVPPGKHRALALAFGVYLDGTVTTGIEGEYAYTKYFGGLDDVLDFAQSSAPIQGYRSSELDRELRGSGLSADQQFLIAHATRSYYGSTQLLDVGGRPFWVVNEGEYCMMNTLDLSVDQMFWELKHNPWVVRNQLDNFVRHYSYVDELKPKNTDGAALLPGGISFTHDMGAHNDFSPPGHSSYELPDLTGCFSYMTAEQLCNWILLAASYVAATADDAWLRTNAHVVRACLDSLDERTGSRGLIDFDSTRCGAGSEITTYDSLDHSLAQTRANAYMGVKAWASFLGLRMMLARLGDDDAADLASDRVVLAATELAAAAAVDGVIPAVLESDNPGHASRILPVVEGLIYPLYWNSVGAEDDFARWAVSSEPTEDAAWQMLHRLTKALRTHTLALLNDDQRRNVFPDGGLKLSSTSNNSWMSKIALFQHVAREVLRLDDDPAIADLFAKADAAHVRWQTDGSGYWACSDQFVSGVAKGSRYYPRIITTALWLDGRRNGSSK